MEVLTGRLMHDDKFAEVSRAIRLSKGIRQHKVGNEQQKAVKSFHNELVHS